MSIAVLWVAIAFSLVVICRADWDLLKRGLPSLGLVVTVMYSLTFLHALHVVAGLLVLGYLLVITLRGKPLAGRVTTLRNCGMFWHFVGVVWGVMFVGMFLL